MRRTKRKRMKKQRFQKKSLQKVLRRRRRKRLRFETSRNFGTSHRWLNSEIRQHQTTLYAPERITLLAADTYNELAYFLAELRQAFVDNQRSLRVNFSRTKKLFPEGMLLLYAELDRLRNTFSNKVLSCVPASNSVVDGVLEHLGMYEWFGYKSSSKPSGDNVTGWKVTCAENVNGPAFGAAIEGLGLKSEQARRLFVGVSEAVTNVMHHSDLGIRMDGLNLPKETKWWMFIHESEDRLFVAICDLGIGIPRSLPLRHGWEAVRHALRVMIGRRRHNDGHMIHAALRLRRSRTQQDYRGLGFNNIINVLNMLPESRMRINSNHGVLTYNPSCRPPAIHVSSFNESILGTIVCWHFPMSGVKP